jgi:hypothetical protein
VNVAHETVGVHLRGFAATVDNLRVACQPKLTR